MPPSLNLRWTSLLSSKPSASGPPRNGRAFCRSTTHFKSNNDPSLTLRRYYIDPHCVVVRGKPSAKLADKLEKDEKIRVAEQVKELGEAGLEAAAAKLEAAKSEHDRPIPSDILTSFPVPDVKSISWIPVQSLQEAGKGRETRRTPVPNEELTKHVQADESPLPFFVQYDHVKVNRTSRPSNKR